MRFRPGNIPPFSCPPPLANTARFFYVRPSLPAIVACSSWGNTGL
jgi:hypothetical protein